MPLVEEQKPKNKGPKGPVVKQFEWFEMQTRVRKIIQEIINPVQYQIVKNSSHIEKLQKSSISFNDRIQYMLKMTTNDPQVFEKGVFKKIQDKFQKQQKTLTFLQEQVKNNTTFIDNKINLIDERMKQSNDMISQIQQLKTSNRQSLKHQTEKFEIIRKNIEENVQKMSQAIQENQKNSREKIQKLQKQIAQNEMKMQNISKQFTKVKEYFQSQKSINDDLIAQQIKLKQQNRVIETKIGEVNRKVKELAKVKPFLQDVQVDFKKLLFKVDNIVPLINQAQINESLYRILPQKFHPRIAVYEFQRYIELNQKVLSRHFEAEPTGIDFNGEQLIRQSQQRNTKLLTKLKLKYYKNNGVEMDFITFQERERLINDFDYDKLCEIVDELEELENQQNDRKKNHKLTEQDIINLVQKQLQTEKTLLITKIQNQISDSKTYLQSSSQLVHKIIQKLQTKMQKHSQNLNNHKMSHELLTKNFQQFSIDFNEKLSNNTEKISILHTVSKEVSNYLEYNFSIIRKLSYLQQNIQLYQKIHTVSIHNKKNYQKYTSNKDQLLKTKLGVMIMSDLDENFDSSKIIHEKQNDSHSQAQKFQEQGEKALHKIKQFILQYANLNEYQLQSQNKFKSSFSKLTRPSKSEIKYKSYSSHNPFSKELKFNELNKSSQTCKTTQKNEGSGLLNIPEFKNTSNTKYCRQSYTSRLSMRKKSSVTPSKASFLQSDDQSQNFKNGEIRNSLACFSELRKQHSRYLK